jgi:hypothetical protein
MAAEHEGPVPASGSKRGRARVELCSHSAARFSEEKKVRETSGALSRAGIAAGA